MTKRTEGILVGLLLAGCVGGIVFVFSMLTDDGAAFAMQEETPARKPIQPLPPLPDEPVVEEESEEGAVDPDTVVLETPPTERVESGAEEETGTDEEIGESEEPTGEGEKAQLTIELRRPADEAERDITIRVVDGDGNPLDDVLVAFRDGAYLVYRQRTAEDGRVLFQPYPTERGPFRVDAIARGYETATAASVAAGATTDIVLTARAAITGRVRAPARGQGLVRLYMNGETKEVKVESDGSFVFEDLDEGHVTVEAVVKPYGRKQQSFYLNAGVTRDVLLRVRNSNRIPIRGTVRFWPRNARGRMTINGIQVAVTATGNFTFKEAVEGLNEVFIDAPERALFKERFQVRATSKSTSYNFRLRPEGKLRGFVSDSRRRGRVAGAEVRVGIDLADRRNEAGLLFPIENVPVVKTDRDGKYEVTRLDQRFVYQIAVLKQGYGLFLDDAIPSPGTTVNPVLPQGPFLFGKLRGFGGVPRDAQIVARPLEAAPERLRFNVGDWNISKSGRNNKAEYGLSGLLPGSYLVRVDAPGFGPLETIIDLREGQRSRLDLRMRRRAQLSDEDDALLLERLPPVIQETGEPDLPPPSDATILRIDVEPKEGEIPYSGVRILFFEDEEEFAPPMEFFEESFEIVGLPEADYRAVITHGALKKPIVRDTIKLRRGAPVSVRMR